MNPKFKFAVIRSYSVFGPTEDAAAEAKKIQDDATAAAEAAKKAPKTYTQKEVDDMTAAQRYGYKKELEKAANKALKDSEDARLSAQERDEARKEAENLQTMYKTEKELAIDREKKLQDSHKKQLDEANEQVKVYKGKYANTLIDNELVQQAALADESVPGQLKKLLKQDTVLIEEINPETGKSTGEQVVRVNFEDVNAEGKPVKLVLSVKDVLKRMKELPEQYGIFFKGMGTSGIGSGNAKGGSSNAAITDTAAYIANRNKNRK